MLSTVEIFDLIKHAHNLPSDYALSKRLGVTAASISKHRSRSFGMSNDLALKCAELLKYDPAYVLLCVNAERANCADEKLAFVRLAGLALAHSRELRLTM